jgi:bifunctional ADP-heptose synthase (sugar kinase/adenylyltransferase)
VFVYCDANRLAPDVPVPVLAVRDTNENPGMAKNVWRNIRSLAGDCDLVTNQDWYNVTKTRYMHKASNHMFFRVDASHDIEPCDITSTDFAAYDLVVVSDYNKGFLSTSDIARICEANPRTFIDTKKPLGSWAEAAFIIKINDYEYRSSPPEATKALDGQIIHTVGDQGCLYQGVRYPVEPVDVRDTSGAGDTFMAALVTRYAESSDMINAIGFANQCASEAVRHRGVTLL